MTGPTREEVERFTPLWSFGEMLECTDGDFVRFTDYEALREKLETAEKGLHDEERFIRSYPNEVRGGKWEAVSRLISGKCRDLEKKAAASNSALTEARAEIERLTKERDALATASWVAGRDAAVKLLNDSAENWDCGHNESRLCDCARDAEQWGLAADEVSNLKPPAALTQPTDATAALQAVKDAEWDACVDAMAELMERMHGRRQDVWPRHIRALRRNPKEGV